MNDFAAIDFETANQYPSSVCSVGVVIVRNREITQKIYRLIHPYPNFYLYWNTQVHGLTMVDTQTAADFPEIWNEIAPEIVGLPLISHFSPFDERCLKAAHSHYGMPYPDYHFHCTCRASRKFFGKTLPNHKLHTVAAHCGFELKNHHHALADAEACAAIALQVWH